MTFRSYLIGWLIYCAALGAWGVMDATSQNFREKLLQLGISSWTEYMILWMVIAFAMNVALGRSFVGAWMGKERTSIPVIVIAGALGSLLWFACGWTVSFLLFLAVDGLPG